MKLHQLRLFRRAGRGTALSAPPSGWPLRSHRCPGHQGAGGRIGVRLFERSSMHGALTAAGQAYLAEVRVVLDRVASAAETARARWPQGLQGGWRSAFAGSMAGTRHAAHRARLRRPCAGHDVNLRELSSAEQLDALLHRQLHAGFINAASVPRAWHAGRSSRPFRLLPARGAPTGA